MGIVGRRSGVGAIAAAIVVSGLAPALAADHREAPLLSAGDLASVDIGDLYVFPSPEDPDSVVFVLTMNPGAGQSVPTPFRSQAKYNLMIDKDGDAKEDARITFDFTGPRADGSQRLKLRSVGLKGMRGQGRTGEDLVVKKDVRLHAGVFDDPFFFDLEGFMDTLSTGTLAFDASRDFAAFQNTNAIVIEVPLEALGGDSSALRVWATTARK